MSLEFTSFSLLLLNFDLMSIWIFYRTRLHHSHWQHLNAVWSYKFKEYGFDKMLQFAGLVILKRAKSESFLQVHLSAFLTSNFRSYNLVRWCDQPTNGSNDFGSAQDDRRWSVVYSVAWKLHSGWYMATSSEGRLKPQVRKYISVSCFVFSGILGMWSIFRVFPTLSLLATSTRWPMALFSRKHKKREKSIAHVFSWKGRCFDVFRRFRDLRETLNWTFFKNPCFIN